MAAKNFKRGSALTIALLLIASVPATAPFAFNSDFDISDFLARLWSPARSQLHVETRAALSRWAEEIVSGHEFVVETSPLLTANELLAYTPVEEPVPLAPEGAPLFGHAMAMVNATKFTDLPKPPARMRPMALPALARVSASGIDVSAGGGSQGADSGPTTISAAAETSTADVAEAVVAQAEANDPEESGIPQHLPGPGALPLLGFGLIGLIAARRRR